MSSGPYTGIGLGGVAEGVNNSSNTLNNNQQQNSKEQTRIKERDQDQQRANALLGIQTGTQNFEKLQQARQNLLNQDTTGWSLERLAERSKALQQIDQAFNRNRETVTGFLKGGALGDMTPIFEAGLSQSLAVEYNPNESQMNLSVYDRARQDWAAAVKLVEDAKAKGPAAMQEALPILRAAEAKLGEAGGKVGLSVPKVSGYLEGYTPEMEFNDTQQTGWRKVINDHLEILGTSGMSREKLTELTQKAAQGRLTLEDMTEVRNNLSTAALIQSASAAQAKGQHGEAFSSYQVIKARGGDLGEAGKGLSVYDDPNSEPFKLAQEDLRKQTILNENTRVNTGLQGAQTTSQTQRNDTFWAGEYQTAKKNNDASGMRAALVRLQQIPGYEAIVAAAPAEIATAEERDAGQTTAMRYDNQYKSLQIDQMVKNAENDDIKMVLDAMKAGALHLLPETTLTKLRSIYTKDGKDPEGNKIFDGLIENSKTNEKTATDEKDVQYRTRVAQLRSIEAQADYDSKVLPVATTKNIQDLQNAIELNPLTAKSNMQKAVFDYYKAGGDLDDPKFRELAKKYGISMTELDELAGFDDTQRADFKDQRTDRQVKQAVENPELFLNSPEKISELAKAFKLPEFIVKSWLENNNRFKSTSRNLDVAQAKAQLIGLRTNTAATQQATDHAARKFPGDMALQRLEVKRVMAVITSTKVSTAIAIEANDRAAELFPIQKEGEILRNTQVKTATASEQAAMKRARELHPGNLEAQRAELANTLARTAAQKQQTTQSAQAFPLEQQQRRETLAETRQRIKLNDQANSRAWRSLALDENADARADQHLTIAWNQDGRDAERLVLSKQDMAMALRRGDLEAINSWRMTSAQALQSVNQLVDNLKPGFDQGKQFELEGLIRFNPNTKKYEATTAIPTAQVAAAISDMNEYKAAVGTQQNLMAAFTVSTANLSDAIFETPDGESILRNPKMKDWFNPDLSDVPVPGAPSTGTPGATGVQKSFAVAGGNTFTITSNPGQMVNGKPHNGFDVVFQAADGSKNAKINNPINQVITIKKVFKDNGKGEANAENGQGYGHGFIGVLEDGTEIIMGHFKDALPFIPGSKITPGQQIGIQGSTGKSSGPHLHWEMKQNGTVMNGDAMTKYLSANTYNPGNGQTGQAVTGAVGAYIKKISKTNWYKSVGSDEGLYIASGSGYVVLNGATTPGLVRSMYAQVLKTAPESANMPRPLVARLLKGMLYKEGFRGTALTDDNIAAMLGTIKKASK